MSNHDNIKMKSRIKPAQYSALQTKKNRITIERVVLEFTSCNKNVHEFLF